MRVVLTEKELGAPALPDDVRIQRFKSRDILGFNNNRGIVAIVGSRATAKLAATINLPELKLFQLTSAGFDGVPTDLFKERGVAVANAGTVYSVPIAETVVLGVLLMAKRIRKNPNNRRFKLLRGYDSTITELKGKKILIMGAGNIGTAIADRFAGFEAEIDGYDVFPVNKPQYGKIIVGRDNLLQCVGEYDYIISTMPDTCQTRGFIDRELLDKTSAAVVVNVGRRAVFNEDDLYRALKNKTLNGAVLDMFEKIPNPITNRFRRLSNVIVFPGVAAISKEVNERLRNHMVKNVRALVSGEPLSNVVNGVK